MPARRWQTDAVPHNRPGVQPGGSDVGRGIPELRQGAKMTGVHGAEYWGESYKKRKHQKSAENTPGPRHQPRTEQHLPWGSHPGLAEEPREQSPGLTPPKTSSCHQGPEWKRHSVPRALGRGLRGFDPGWDVALVPRQSVRACLERMKQFPSDLTATHNKAQKYL